MTGRTTRRVAFWAAGVLMIAGAVAMAMVPGAVPVDLATVRRGAMTVTLDHEGKTRVHERFVVSAPVAGRVLRIELQPGDPVIANQTVLATFLPGAAPLLDARARAEAESHAKAAAAMVEEARAQRDSAVAQSQLASAERQRAHTLAAAGYVTDQARQAADTEAITRQRAADAAESAVRAAEHDLEAAQAALIEPGRRGEGAEKGRVLSLRSPISGVVLQRLHESEALVPQGEPLVEVADVSAIEVAADFLSTDAVRIKPGMPALIDQWGGAAPLNGRVRRVEPSGFMKVSALGVEEQRVWVIIDFDEPRAAWQALGDGYRVEARVIVWQQPGVVQAPASSLFRRDGRWAVFVVDNGVARVRTVEVSHVNDADAAIASGLRPGERVIVHPPDTVSDGVRVSERGV